MIDFSLDTPISETGEDKFRRLEFSHQIAEICRRKIGSSSVIGIYGEWGEGKSSVKNLIGRELDQQILQIHFNPWLFKNQEDLLSAFFGMFAAKLKKKIKTRSERLNEAIARYSESIGILHAVPKASWIVVVVKSLLSLFVKSRELTVQEAKERIDKFIMGSGLNIVIFIDDIDRLDGKEVKAIFKLVKLLADFPRTTYILLFDPEIVARMLAPSYGGQIPESGYRYLEKVIQFPLTIPKANNQSLIDFFKNVLQETGEQYEIDLNSSQEELDEIIAEGLMRLLDTPRKIIRFINIIRFVTPLVREECNFMDLLVIESFKVSLPKYYNHIRSNKDIYLHNFLGKQDHHSPSRKATLDQINPFVRNLSTPVQNAVQALTQRLFPHFIWSDPSEAKLFGSEALLIQKKICSPDYFDRYFAFSIQDDDFPDSLFHKFYLQSQNHSEETLISQILDDFKKYSIENVAFKIVTHRSAIHKESAKKMIVAICRISDRFSQPEGFDFGTPFSFLALSVVTMIKSLDGKESFQIAKKAIESSNSLFFAAELIARLVMPISRDQPKTIFEGMQSFELKGIYIFRLKSLIDQEGFFEAIPERVMARQLLWWYDVNANEIKSTLLTLLELDPQASLKILRIFTPTLFVASSDTNSKVWIKADFEENEFHLIDKVIGAHTIYASLLGNWGNQSHLPGIETLGIHDEIDDKSLIGKFQRMYQKYTALRSVDRNLLDRK